MKTKLHEKNSRRSLRKSPPAGATGGKREGAGRKRHVRAKLAQEAQIQAVLTGITPLEYMLNLMRDENEETAVRFAAAQSAAPYLHPRLAAVSHTIEPSKWTDDELERAVRILDAIEIGPESADQGSLPGPETGTGGEAPRRH